MVDVPDGTSETGWNAAREDPADLPGLERAASPIPAYINFNGQFNQYDNSSRASGLSWYQECAQGADWITADLARVLPGGIDPPALGATAPAPLQVAWRSSAGREYFFVLSLTDATARDQAIHLAGTGSAASAAVYGEHRSVPMSSGTITDSFGPYSIHIYEIPAS